MTIFRTQRIYAAFIFGLALVTSATAGVLEMKPGDKTIEGVKVAKEAIFQSEGKPVALSLYASGLRKKKVALFWAKVYVGQVFTTPGLPVPAPSMEVMYATLRKQPVVAFTLTFLRDVGVDRQKDAFEDSLETNGIDPKSEMMKPLFAMVVKAGDAKDTLTTTIVLERRKDGTEWVHYENGKGELQSMAVEKGMNEKVMSIWVGKPADSGMERLHNQYLGKAD